jgi:hypothetical protein
MNRSLQPVAAAEAVVVDAANADVIGVPGTLSVRCFDSLESAAFLRNDIDALNRRSVRPDPFSTYSFYETFFRHDELNPGGGGMRVWFLAAFRNGRLIGHLALQHQTRKVLGMRTSTVGFLVTHDTDRPHVVAAPEDLAAVTVAFYQHLLSRRQEWSHLAFAQQDGCSSLFPPPAGVDLSGYLVRQWPTLENCTITVRWGSLRGYVDALTRKFRTNLGRQMRGLLAAGNVELLSSSDPASTPALFELFMGIEARSWKSQAQADTARHPQRVAYFRRLLDAGQPMRVSVHILTLDGVPVAGLISGAFLRGLYALNIVYDDRLSQWAPGSAMLLLGMRQAIEGRFEFFNLMSGFGYYKVRWLADITETCVAQIYRVGSLPYWRRLVGDWRRQLVGTQPDGTDAVRFNRVRRALSRPEPAQPGALPKAPLPLSADERARVDALLAQIRAGQGEFLSGAALAAVMPFEF